MESESMGTLRPGYSRVRFGRPVGAWTGGDGKTYGPYGEGDEAVVETAAAGVLEALGIAEVLERGPAPRTSEEIAAGLPDELRTYLKLAGLDPVGEPTREVPPGSAEPLYVVPVRDEGAGEVVRIVYPWPRRMTDRYRISAVTNKRGESVLVVVPFEGARPSETEEAWPPPKPGERSDEVVRRVYRATGDPRRALEHASALRDGLRVIAEEKLRDSGYRVLRLEEIPRRILVAGIPSVVAVKGNEYLVAEVRVGGRLRVYADAGARIVLVTDLEEGRKIEVWGLKELSRPREAYDIF